MKKKPKDKIFQDKVKQVLEKNNLFYNIKQEWEKKAFYVVPISIKEHREVNKTLVCPTPMLYLFLDSGTNPYWVWDGQYPKLAQTFTIHAFIPAQYRKYRHKNWHTCEWHKIHEYSRTMDKTLQLLNNHISSLISSGVLKQNREG